MTDDDLAVLLYIATHNAQHGRPPTLRQIADTRGMRFPAVKATVRRLRAQGQLAGLYEGRLRLVTP